MADRDFEIKSFSDVLDDLNLEIQAQQDNLSPGKPRLTDFSVGSIIYTITSSIAATISSYWSLLEQLSNTFYIQSATGSRLRRRLQDFGFETKTGSKATGTVQVIRPASSTFIGSITAGTQLFYGTREFVVTSPSTAFPPSSGSINVVSVNVQAVSNGLLDNLSTNTQLISLNPLHTTLEFRVGTQMNSSNTGTIVGALSGGLDDETDEDARIRFQTYIQNLGKGTLSVIKSEVNTVSGVRNCKVYDNSRVINGSIDGPETNNNVKAYPGYIVIQVQPSDANAGLSETLVAKIKQAVESVKAAGVAYQIHSVPVLEVDLFVTIRTSLANSSPDWTNYTANLTTLIEDSFNKLDLKESLYTWVLQSDLITYDKIKAPGGITIVVKNTSGTQIDVNGKVTPSQDNDGGILSLRNLTFIHQSI